MLLEHGLPPEVQVWIIRKRIPRSTDTLEQCGLVPGEQSSIYLYLASRQAAGLTDETYQRKYGVLFGGKDQGQILLFFLPLESLAKEIFFFFFSKFTFMRMNIKYFDDALLKNHTKCIWFRSRNWGCLVTWFCYQLIAKPGNKTASVPWPDPYKGLTLYSFSADDPNADLAARLEDVQLDTSAVGTPPAPAQAPSPAGSETTVTQESEAGNQGNPLAEVLQGSAGRATPNLPAPPPEPEPQPQVRQAVGHCDGVNPLRLGQNGSHFVDSNF